MKIITNLACRPAVTQIAIANKAVDVVDTSSTVSTRIARALVHVCEK